MQENRSFDHYFGAMRGVRGFADPRPVTLPSGKSVWNQPGEPARRTWSLDRTHGWYDLTVTARDDDGFEHRYAGHLENGRDSITDPAMGDVV